MPIMPPRWGVREQRCVWAAEDRRRVSGQESTEEEELEIAAKELESYGSLTLRAEEIQGLQATLDGCSPGKWWTAKRMLGLA